MGTGRRAAGHASGLYARAFRAAVRPIRSAEDEVQHLHQVEHEGVSAEAPFIAILGVFLFFFPIFLVILGIAFTAYYLG